MTIQAPYLLDDVLGNVGLVPDAHDLVRLLVTEPDGVAVSDSTGNLADLMPPATLTEPAITEEAWTGRGRVFTIAGTTGLEALDAADGDTLTQRDATIQVLLSLDLTTAGTAVQTVYCRGKLGSAAEYYALGLELTGGATLGYVTASLFWCDSAGTVRVDTGAEFFWPGDGVTFLLTATRRWVSTTEVVCRYYVGDQLVQERTSVYGDIAGATTATTTIGARYNGAAWVKHLCGTLEQLKVLDYEMSGEEIAATWRRMSLHQPAGLARLEALSPPGNRWFDNRGSDIAKIMKTLGTALGGAAAKADELVTTWLPDKAYSDWLERWESLTGLAPKPLDSLDTRRARVAAFLQRDNGYSIPKLQDALAPLFDQDAANVVITELSNEWTDTFTTLDELRWHEETAAQWSIVSNQLQCSVTSGTDLSWDASNRNPCHVRTPMFAAISGYVANPVYVDDTAHPSIRDGVIFQCKATFTTTPGETLVGLFLYNTLTGEKLWFGIRNAGGTLKIGWQAYLDGTAIAFDEFATGVAATQYLRVRFIDSVTLSLEYSASGFASMTAETIDLTGDIPTGFLPNYVGIACVCDDGTISTDLLATFDDFTLRSPLSETAFLWYAYRDLGEPGSPDMAGADALVKRLKPAHTYARAITEGILLCDDTGCVCDWGPLGGY